MRSLAALQAWLDASAAATMGGDWAAYRDHVDLPFLLVTESQSLLVADEESLRRGFDQFRAMLETMRVTDYVRLGETSAEIGPGLVSGAYVTHLMAGAHRVVPPFRSTVALRLDGDRWRAACIASALRNTQWPLGVPDVATHFDGRRESR